MARNSNIEWTDDTWNPIRGCSRVSEGCRHCYAEQVAYRFSGPGQGYEGLVQIGADGQRRAQWNGEIRFVESHLLDPLRWGPVVEHTVACEAGWGDLGDGQRRHRPKCACPTRRRRIFVNSMSDLFHPNVTDEMRDQVFAAMALSPQHDFQVLTKRPELMLAYLQQVSDERDMQRWIQHADVFAAAMKWTDWPEPEWPLPNVWLGVSVEDQATADARIPLLLKTPAAWRYISAEPLLGNIVLPRKVHLPRRVRGDFPIGHGLIAMPGYHTAISNHLGALAIQMGNGKLLGIKPDEFEDAGIGVDWVIVGGESGRDEAVRPMHPSWVRHLRTQCAAANTPFFFKQWGEWKSEQVPGVEVELGSLKPNQRVAMGVPGHHTLFTRVGKKVAGALLSGAEHKEFPGVRA